MKKTKKASIHFSILFLLLLLAETAFTAETIRIGVLAKRGVEKCYERWSPTADYLSKQISNYTFEIVPLEFDEVVETVKKGQVEFVLANPAFYVELEHKYQVSMIATMKNKWLTGTYTTIRKPQL